MAKIRSLGNQELRQVLSLLERFTGDEFNYPVLERFQGLYLPFHMISHAMPLALKFLPEINVAVQDGKVLGLVWLNRDGKRQDRWKLDQLIIDPEAASSFDIARQLVYYAINKLGGMGVETFLAYVDPHYTEGLALLKDCGFRHCTKLHTFLIENLPEALRTKPPLIQGLREANSSDARKLQELYSETLVPEVRISLRKSPADLYPGVAERLWGRFKGEFYKRWVVSYGSQDYLSGSVAISTWDYKQFELSLMISPAWEHGLEDLLRFALHKVYQSTSTPKITLNTYDFQKTKLALLEELGFQRDTTTEILVKDYWLPAKDKIPNSQNPVLLFARGSRTSPA